MRYTFCTRQDVKAFSITSGDSEAFDDLIDSIIDVWTANAKAFCRRDFVFGEYSEQFSTIKVGKTMLIRLKEAPLTIDDDHPFVIKHNNEVVDENLYEINKEKGLIRLQVHPLSPGIDNLSITYWGGICVEDGDDETSKVIVKCPLRSAVANQCAYALIRTVQSNQGQQAANNGRGTANTTPAAMGFLPEVSMVLANYRLSLTGRE